MAVEVLKGNGVGVDVEGESGLDGDVHDHETLGTQSVGENLDGVADEETRPGERVHDSEEPDEEDHGLVGTRSALLVPEGRGDGPEDEGTEHATGGSQESRATAELVDEESHGDGDDEGKAGLTSGETELGGLLAFETGGVVELRGIVGDDGVSRPLGEETEGEEDGKTIAVATGLEEVEVAGVLVVLVLHADGLLDLAELELNERVVLVAVGVVLGEDVEGLLVLLLGDEVTGGLGDPVDEDELDDRGEGLDEGGDTPRPLVVGVLGAERQPGDNQGTDVPEAVVDGGETGTMLRVAQLGEKHRGGDLGEGVAETEEDTATHEGAHVGAGTLEDGTDDHDNAADGDGELTTEVIGDDRAAEGNPG